MRLIEIFETYIVGDFHNQNQINDEAVEGVLKHPFAKHINRNLNDRVMNKPQYDTGFYLLEESIYEKNGKVDLKPHIFKFDEDGQGNVILFSFNLPKQYSISEIRNDNKDFRLDYNELELSLFHPMTYYYQEGLGFLAESVSDFGGGKIFTLKEVISKDRLEVMETMEINGVRVTSYDKPILYERINEREV